MNARDNVVLWVSLILISVMLYCVIWFMNVKPNDYTKLDGFKWTDNPPMYIINELSK